LNFAWVAAGKDAATAGKLNCRAAGGGTHGIDAAIRTLLPQDSAQPLVQSHGGFNFSNPAHFLFQVHTSFFAKCSSKISLAPQQIETFS
jgi:hypothetical protein